MILQLFVCGGSIQAQLEEFPSTCVYVLANHISMWRDTFPLCDRFRFMTRGEVDGLCDEITS